MMSSVLDTVESSRYQRTTLVVASRPRECRDDRRGSVQQEHVLQRRYRVNEVVLLVQCQIAGEWQARE